MIAVKGIFILLIDRMQEVRFYNSILQHRKIVSVFCLQHGVRGMSGSLKIFCLSFNLVLSADFIPEFSGTFLSYRNNFPGSAAGRMIKEMNNVI